MFGDQTFHRLATLFGAVWSCLIVLIKFESHQTFDQTTSNIRSNNFKHFFCSHAYHACLAACIRYRLLFTYVACPANEEASVNVAEIGVIETEETPSRKGKQRKGMAMKSIVTKCMQVQQASISRENLQELFASFRGHLEYLRSSVSVGYYCSILSLLFSLRPAPGLPSSIFPFSILL